MADTKFTPGPWTTHVGWDVTGYPCFFIHGFSGTEKRDIPTLEANAHLIAAAPEMYEALKGVEAAIHLESTLSTGVLKGSEAWANLRKHLQSVLAKAEGVSRG